MRDRIASECAACMLHRLPFGVVELARLVEDGVADAELADVVQQRGTLEPASLLGAELHLLRDHVGKQRDALAVAAGVGALGIDHLGEGGRDVVEIVLVDRHARLRRLEAKIACCQSSVRSISQNAGRAATRSKAATSCGSNHVRRPVLDFAQRRFGAVRDWNTSITCAISAMRE